MIQKIWKIIKSVYLYEKKTDISRTALSNVCLVFAIVMFAINIKNIENHAVPAVYVTLVVEIVMFALAVFIKVLKNLKQTIVIAMIFFVVIMTYYMATGINEGFGNFWILIIADFVLVVVGMPLGLWFCILFCVESIVLFWTPMSEHLLYDYDKVYCLHFPLIYIIFFVFVFVVNIIYKEYKIIQDENNKNLEHAVSEERKKIEDMILDSVITISKVIDAKDIYTREHSERVAMYSKLIAEKLGMNEKEQRNVYNIGLMHDIGKIAVPDKVLNKPGKLTDEEFDIMRQHVVWGEKILKDLNFIEGVSEGAMYHHERYDGRGYIKGLKGKEIPKYARIISTADSLDAMNSNRVYRNRLDKHYIYGEFEKGRGTQFDEKIADIVLELIRTDRIKIGV